MSKYSILSKYSIITGVVLSLYFIIMDLLGFSHLTGLRLFNGVILGAGIWWAVKSKTNTEDWNYLTGLRSGFQTGIGALTLFCLVFLLYAGIINPDIVFYINESIGAPFNFNIFLLLAVIILEGTAASAIMSLIVMQYYKSKEFKKKEVTQPIES